MDALYPVQVEALRLDEATVRLLRGRGAVDLALGETLDRLFEGDRLRQLGWAKASDYLRERLGVPARTAFVWLQLARGLRTRPLLRRSVLRGAVTPRKALVVLPVAVGSEEAAWTAAAMTRTVAELVKAVRGRGKEPPLDTFEAESLRLRMAPEAQDRLDRAIALAQETLGYGARRWQCVEAICQEWLGSFGAWVPEGEASPAPPPAPDWTRAVERQLRAIEEVSLVVETEEALGEDALALDGRLRRLLEARRGFDEAFGVLAARIAEGCYWRELGFDSLEAYCQERLGVSPRSFRERVWLERRMCALPGLREALVSGRLTYSKAVLVAREATATDVEAWMSEAETTTCQQLERESTEREERRDRAAGVRRLWGPKDAVETVAAAIVSAQAQARAQGERLDAGEALARIADHFVEVWTRHRMEPRVSGVRRIVLLRHGGLCAVPGCTRPARHEHHIMFRSHGGSDDPSNLVALCASHHLYGVHRGYLKVTGRAGERLVWEFQASGEVWVTQGDDDVRRVRRGA